MKTVFIYIFIFIFACNYSYSDDNIQSSSIEFIENKGQWVDRDGNAMPDVKFKANVEGREVYVRNSGLSFVLRKFEPDSTKIEEKKQDVLLRDNEMEPGTVYTHRMDIEFSGANYIAQISGMEKLPQYNNYYYPHCADGITHVPVYAKVEYNNVYDNIDLMVYANKENSLEYDFIVKPGASPQQIKLKLIESGNTELSTEGNLIAETILGKIEQMKPYTYQMINGGKKEIQSSFVLNGNEISFEVEDYDMSKELVIDPITKVWGTYFGGANDEGSYNLKLDSKKNIIFCGYTYSDNSGDLIATTGSHQYYAPEGEEIDGFLAKFDNNGKRLWSTYYGGDSIDVAIDCAIDSNDYIYITGNTRSPNTNNLFSTSNAHQSEREGIVDAFIAKFDSDGIRIWGTLFGGENDDAGNNIIINQDKILVLGVTKSTTNIAYGNSYQSEIIGDDTDLFLVEFDWNGNLIWGTYYGGELYDVPSRLICDHESNIIFCGFTDSETHIATDDAFKKDISERFYDAFLAKFSPDGHRIWATYYGNNWDEMIYGHYTKVSGVAVDNDNNIIMAGTCKDTAGMVTENAHQTDWVYKRGIYMNSGYIAKFDPNGKRLWGTIYCGDGSDILEAVITDRNNNIYAVGTTCSENFTGEHDYIATEDALYQELVGRQDGVIVKLLPTGERIWGTYFGGTESDLTENIQIDDRDNLIVIGQSQSIDNIGLGDTYKKNNSGLWDVYLSKIYDPTINIKDVNGILVGGETIVVKFETFIDESISKDYYLQISDASGNIESFQKLEGKGSSSGLVTSFIPEDIKYSDKYRFRIVAENPLTTTGLPTEDTYTVYPKPEMDILGKKVVVTGYQETYTVDYQNWISNTWSVSGGEIVNEDSNGITILWTEAGSGSIKLIRNIADAGYSDSTELEVKIYDNPDMEIAGLNEVCADDTANYAISIQSNITTEWEVTNGDIIIDNDSLITVIWTLEGTGKVKLTYSIEDGEYIDSNNIEVTIHPRPEKPIIEQEGTVLVSSSESGNQWYKENILIPEAFENSYIPDESGNYTVRVTNEFGCESEYSDVFEYTKTGIYENIVMEGIKIYPNPGDGEIIIEFNNPEYQYISLSITDIFGREVKSLCSSYKTPGNITFNWNTNAVIDCVYFCRLSLGDENFVKAVVVSR